MLLHLIQGSVQAFQNVRGKFWQNLARSSLTFASAVKASKSVVMGLSTDYLALAAGFTETKTVAGDLKLWCL